MDEKVIKVYSLNSYNEREIVNALSDDLFEDIKPGNKVVLKPNWVCESHLDKPSEWQQIITHPLITKVVLQKVIKKLRGQGKVIIADGPDSNASFDKILAYHDIDAWHKMASEAGIELDIIDLRDEEWISQKGVIIGRKSLTSDPIGKIEINLKDETSEFYDHVKSKRGYYGADYNTKLTNDAHDGSNNLYSVSRSVLEADVFINMPKLKTHKKAGITCSLKNLVGINTNKNYLPHHNEGSPEVGGDQFPSRNFNSKIEGRVASFVKRRILQNNGMARIFAVIRPPLDWFFGKTDSTIRSGNWYGNDTLWRMVLDLNKVLLYAAIDGSLRVDQYASKKKYISIVDGIIAGERNGPLKADINEAGLLIVGYNPASVDFVCALLMGFDPNKIPVVSNSFKIKKYKIANFPANAIKINYNGRLIEVDQLPSDITRHFEPHFGWKKHIEIQDT